MGLNNYDVWKFALFVVVSLLFICSGQSKRQQIEEIAKRQLDSLLQTEDYLAVFWHGKNCKTCDRISSILETKTTELDENGIKVVKLNDKKTAKQYGVLSVPGLTFFKGGKGANFDGDLTNEEQIMDFLASPEALELEDQIEDVNSKQLEKLVGERPFVAVFFYNHQPESAAALLELENIDTQADKMNIAFVKINDLVLVDEYGLSQLPAIVYFRQSIPIPYDGDITNEQAVLEWLIQHRSIGEEEEVIEEATAKSLDAMVGTIEKVVVLFYDPDYRKLEQLFEVMEKIDDDCSSRDIQFVKTSEPESVEAFGIQKLPALVFFKQEIPNLYEGNLLDETVALKWILAQSEEDAIEELTGTMLDKLIKQSRHLVVLFYRRHADDTPATIELLETIDDDLDKVEAHLVKTSDLSAAEEYGLLESIPDIVFFENGIPSLYNGPLNSAPLLVAWIQSQIADDSIEDVTDEMLDKLVSGQLAGNAHGYANHQDVGVLFYSKDDPASERILEVLENIDDDCDRNGIILVKIDNAEEALAYGVEAPALVYFENTIPHLFEGNLASDNEVLGWLIHQMKNDLIEEVTDEMLEMLAKKHQHVAAVIYDKDDRISNKALHHLESIDDDAEKNYIFLVKFSASDVKEANDELTFSGQTLKELPALVLFSENEKVIVYEGDLTEENKVLAWLIKETMPVALSLKVPEDEKAAKKEKKPEEKPAKSEKQPKTEKPAKNDKPVKSEKTEKPAKAEKTDKNAKADKAAKPEKPPKGEKPAKSGKEATEKPAKADKAPKDEKSAKPGKEEKKSKPKKVEVVEEPDVVEDVKLSINDEVVSAVTNNRNVVGFFSKDFPASVNKSELDDDENENSLKRLDENTNQDDDDENEESGEDESREVLKRKENNKNPKNSHSDESDEDESDDDKDDDDASDESEESGEDEEESTLKLKGAKFNSLKKDLANDDDSNENEDESGEDEVDSGQKRKHAKFNTLKKDLNDDDDSNEDEDESGEDDDASDESGESGEDDVDTSLKRKGAKSNALKKDHDDDSNEDEDESGEDDDNSDEDEDEGDDDDESSEHCSADKGKDCDESKEDIGDDSDDDDSEEDDDGDDDDSEEDNDGENGSSEEDDGTDKKSADNDDSGEDSVDEDGSEEDEPEKVVEKKVKDTQKSSKSGSKQVKDEKKTSEKSKSKSEAKSSKPLKPQKKETNEKKSSSTGENLSKALKNHKNILIFVYDKIDKVVTKIISNLGKVEESFAGKELIFMNIEAEEVHDITVEEIPSIVYFKNGHPNIYQDNMMNEEAIFAWIDKHFQSNQDIIEDYSAGQIKSYLQNQTYLMVLVYGADCETCEESIHHLEDIDDDADAVGVRMVKTDDKEFVEQFGIEEFPAVVYFENNNPHIYNGDPREESELLTWLLYQMKEDTIENINRDLMIKMIAQYEFLGVFFYSGSEDSGKMLRHLELIDDEALEYGVKMVKLDDPLMAKKYGHREPPGLGYFRKGNYIKYDGDKFDDEEMLDWLTDPNVMEVSDQIEKVNRKMFDKMTTLYENVAVIFITEKDCKTCEPVLQEMENIDDEAEAAGIPIVKLEDKELAKSLGVFAHPALVMFRQFGKEPVIFSGDLKNEDAILEWLLIQKDPTNEAIEEQDGEGVRKIVENDEAVAVFIYTHEECETCLDILQGLENIDDDADRQNIALVKTTDEEFAAEMGVSEFPGLVFFKDGIPNLFDGDMSHEEEVLDWLIEMRVDNHIEHITRPMLEEMVTEIQYLAVFFYKQNCRTCDQILAELENIDDECDGFGILMVKLQDTVLAKRYGIKTFPSLVYFRNGNPLTFDGDLKDEVSVLSWLLDDNNRELDDAIESVNFKMLDKLLNSSPFMAVFFYDEDCVECDVILESLENIDEEADLYGIDFVKNDDPQAARHYHIYNTPALVYFRKNLPVVFEGDLTDEEGILSWLTSQEVFEIVDEIEQVNRKMLEKILDENEFVAVYFYSDDCSECDKVLKGLEKIDQEADSLDITFVKVNDQRYAKKYGVNKLPALVYFRRKFPSIYRDDLLNESEILDWLKRNRYKPVELHWIMYSVLSVALAFLLYSIFILYGLKEKEVEVKKED